MLLLDVTLMMGSRRTGMFTNGEKRERKNQDKEAKLITSEVAERKPVWQMQGGK